MVNPIILRKAAFTLFLMTLASAVYGQSMDFAKYSRQRSYESQNNTKVCTLSYSNLSGGKIYCNDVEISQEQYMDASMILNPKLWYQYDGGSRNRKSGIIMMSIGVPLFFPEQVLRQVEWLAMSLGYNAGAGAYGTSTISPANLTAALPTR